MSTPDVTPIVPPAPTAPLPPLSPAPKPFKVVKRPKYNDEADAYFQLKADAAAAEKRNGNDFKSIRAAADLAGDIYNALRAAGLTANSSIKTSDGRRSVTLKTINTNHNKLLLKYRSIYMKVNPELPPYVEPDPLLRAAQDQAEENKIGDNVKRLNIPWEAYFRTLDKDQLEALPGPLKTKYPIINERIKKLKAKEKARAKIELEKEVKEEVVKDIGEVSLENVYGQENQQLSNVAALVGSNRPFHLADYLYPDKSVNLIESNVKASEKKRLSNATHYNYVSEISTLSRAQMNSIQHKLSNNAGREFIPDKGNLQIEATNVDLNRMPVFQTIHTGLDSGLGSVVKELVGGKLSFEKDKSKLTFDPFAAIPSNIARMIRGED